MSYMIDPSKLAIQLTDSIRACVEKVTYGVKATADMIINFVSKVVRITLENAQKNAVFFSGLTNCDADLGAVYAAGRRSLYTFLLPVVTGMFLFMMLIGVLQSCAAVGQRVTQKVLQVLALIEAGGDKSIQWSSRCIWGFPGAVVGLMLGVALAMLPALCKGVQISFVGAYNSLAVKGVKIGSVDRSKAINFFWIISSPGLLLGSVCGFISTLVVNQVLAFVEVFEGVFAKLYWGASATTSGNIKANLWLGAIGSISGALFGSVCGVVPALWKGVQISFVGVYNSLAVVGVTIGSVDRSKANYYFWPISFPGLLLGSVCGFISTLVVNQVLAFVEVFEGVFAKLYWDNSETNPTENEVNIKANLWLGAMGSMSGALFGSVCGVLPALWKGVQISFVGAYNSLAVKGVKIGSVDRGKANYYFWPISFPGLLLGSVCGFISTLVVNQVLAFVEVFEGVFAKLYWDNSETNPTENEVNIKANLWLGAMGSMSGALFGSVCGVLPALWKGVQISFVGAYNSLAVKGVTIGSVDRGKANYYFWPISFPGLLLGSVCGFISTLVVNQVLAFVEVFEGVFAKLYWDNSETNPTENEVNIKANLWLGAMGSMSGALFGSVCGVLPALWKGVQISFVGAYNSLAVKGVTIGSVDRSKANYYFWPISFPGLLLGSVCGFISTLVVNQVLAFVEVFEGVFAKLYWDNSEKKPTETEVNIKANLWLGAMGSMSGALFGSVCGVLPALWKGVQISFVGAYNSLAVKGVTIGSVDRSKANYYFWPISFPGLLLGSVCGFISTLVVNQVLAFVEVFEGVFAKLYWDNSEKKPTETEVNIKANLWLGAMGSMSGALFGSVCGVLPALWKGVQISFVGAYNSLAVKGVTIGSVDRSKANYYFWPISFPGLLLGSVCGFISTLVVNQVLAFVEVFEGVFAKLYWDNSETNPTENEVNIKANLWLGAMGSMSGALFGSVCGVLPALWKGVQISFVGAYNSLAVKGVTIGSVDRGKANYYFWPISFPGLLLGSVCGFISTLVVNQVLAFVEVFEGVFAKLYWDNSETNPTENEVNIKANLWLGAMGSMSGALFGSVCGVLPALWKGVQISFVGAYNSLAVKGVTIGSVDRGKANYYFWPISFPGLLLGSVCGFISTLVVNQVLAFVEVFEGVFAKLYWDNSETNPTENEVNIKANLWLGAMGSMSGALFGSVCGVLPALWKGVQISFVGAYNSLAVKGVKIGSVDRGKANYYFWPISFPGLLLGSVCGFISTLVVNQVLAFVEVFKVVFSMISLDDLATKSSAVSPPSETNKNGGELDHANINTANLWLGGVGSILGALVGGLCGLVKSNVMMYRIKSKETIDWFFSQEKNPPAYVSAVGHRAWFGVLGESLAYVTTGLIVMLAQSFLYARMAFYGCINVALDQSIFRNVFKSKYATLESGYSSGVIPQFLGFFIGGVIGFGIGGILSAVIWLVRMVKYPVFLILPIVFSPFSGIAALFRSQPKASGKYCLDEWGNLIVQNTVTKGQGGVSIYRKLKAAIQFNVDTDSESFVKEYAKLQAVKAGGGDKHKNTNAEPIEESSQLRNIFYGEPPQYCCEDIEGAVQDNAVKVILKDKLNRCDSFSSRLFMSHSERQVSKREILRVAMLMDQRPKTTSG